MLEQFLPILEGTLGQRRLITALDEVTLPGKEATSLALVVNELISNAIKHGTGDIEITLRVEENRATLEVCDDGPGFAIGFDPETATNTGLDLLKSITQMDLNGVITYKNRDSGGARVVISFPVPQRIVQRF